MKRNEHLFQFNGKQIANAARSEFEYHTSRTAYWKERQTEAAKQARLAGVEVREIDVTGGKRVDVILDPTVAAELQLCANKIASHQAASDRLQIEAAAYATQPERAYDLQPDDVIYFRLAGGPRAE